MPIPASCPSGDGHIWRELGTVGHKSYSCAKCGTQVVTKSTPFPQDCPSGGSHTWRLLADNTPKANSSSKSSSKSSGSSRSGSTKDLLVGIGVILVAAFFVLKFVFFSGANMLNLATIYRYDFGTYFNNIITAHQNSYIMLTGEEYIYRKIPQMRDINNIDYILAAAPKGQVLKNKGYRTKTGSSWVAVKFYQDNKARYGYLYVPYKMGYSAFKIDSVSGIFTSYAEARINEIEKQNRSKLIQTINTSDLDFITIEDSAALQAFEESDNYKKYRDIAKYGNWGVYKVFMHKNDMKEFKKIHNEHSNPKLIITLRDTISE